jgi:hypothetical protein
MRVKQVENEDFGDSKKSEDFGKKKLGAPEGARLFYVKAPKLLLDMRHVYERPAGEDVTESQRRMRRYMEEDFGKFLADLRQAELAFKRMKEADRRGRKEKGTEEPSRASAVLVSGSNEEKLEQLMEELWLKWKQHKNGVVTARLGR